VSGSKKGGGGGFAPPENPQLTLAQLQTIFDFFEKLRGSRRLKWWVIAAGLGAILDGLHVVWLAFSWLVGRVR